ncbi:hypothetical protein D3C73_778720 [compost metagenome]
MPAQGSRGAVHLLGQAIEPRRGIQLRAEQLANSPQPGLAPGEFGVLFTAPLGHGLVSDDIGERQGLVEPALVEGESVVQRAETQRAIEVFGIGRPIVGRRVFEACRP